MAKDLSDTVRDALGNAVREAVKNAGNASPKPKRNGGGPFSGAKGLAAGAGLAAAAPLAKKGVDAIRHGGLAAMSPASMATKAGDKVGSKVKETVSDKVDQAGGAGGIAKEAASGLLPGGGGGGGGSKNDMPGVGKGRRMPIQQSIDVAVDLETAYNQFTQFEDWPQFMHRVTNVSQDDDDTIRFSTKIWGKTKEFEAKIVTQRPDDRIKWKVAQGITHSGVASFHELAPRLTRIEITLDVAPGSLIEKAARGMRHIKRAVRADLHRYKAFIEMQELETGAWRGVIEDGEVVEPHDDSYDEERDYSEVEDLQEQFGDSGEGDSGEGDSGEGDSGDEDDGDDERDEPIPVEELPRDKTGRFKKGAGARATNGKAAASSRSSSSRSSSGNGKAEAKSSGSGSRRSSGSRSRGATNGSSQKKRSSSGSSSRRRSSSSRS